jgi:UDP-N-acetylglucosamine transferase subunit ALG13
MIFVTVGTCGQGFERLIKEMDIIAGKIEEEVIMQIGSSSYIPKNGKFFTYTNSDDEFADYIHKARLIVTHGGAGSILDALKAEKPVIIVPRLERYNEIIDDHQLELASELKDSRADVVLNINELERVIYSYNSCEYKYESNNKNLVHFLKRILSE